MNTLPDKGVIISRVLTDQKVVGSSPAGCTILVSSSPTTRLNFISVSVQLATLTLQHSRRF
jgi:hypothetical protein